MWNNILKLKGTKNYFKGLHHYLSVHVQVFVKWLYKVTNMTPNWFVKLAPSLTNISVTGMIDVWLIYLRNHLNLVCLQFIWHDGKILHTVMPQKLWNLLNYWGWFSFQRSSANDAHRIGMRAQGESSGYVRWHDCKSSMFYNFF
jgi:hypothetical protein